MEVSLVLECPDGTAITVCLPMTRSASVPARRGVSLGHALESRQYRKDLGIIVGANNSLFVTSSEKIYLASSRLRVTLLLYMRRCFVECPLLLRPFGNTPSINVKTIRVGTHQEHLAGPLSSATLAVFGLDFAASRSTKSHDAISVFQFEQNVATGSWPELIMGHPVN